MGKLKVLIIGAGVVGLAIAQKLSQTTSDLVLVEKEGKFGQHTSSRNSEIIHSGIYYPQNSLKATLCIKGNQMLYDFLKKYKINYQECGKIVAAVNSDEMNALLKLKKNGEKNQVRGLSILSEDECKKLEPQIIAQQGLWVPSTGILDTHQFLKTLEILTEQNRGIIVYNTKVTDIKKSPTGYQVFFDNQESIETEIIINSGGLFADKIAQMVGINIQKYKLKLYWAKGEYYKTTKIKDINHLIFPLPDPAGKFLGIHLTYNLAGEIRFGPNIFYTSTLDYSFDESYKGEFIRAIKRYLDITPLNLSPDETGIRPKLQGPNDSVRDFYIEEESKKGYSKFINLIGIESPGITASLAIADYVGDLIKEYI